MTAVRDPACQYHTLGGGLKPDINVPVAAAGNVFVWAGSCVPVRAAVAVGRVSASRLETKWLLGVGLRGVFLCVFTPPGWNSD